MKINLPATMCIILILVWGCDKVIFRKINCREFLVTGENYWFPIGISDTVGFTSSTFRKKIFTVVDKYIAHRTKYTSDKGCGCKDNTGILLSSGLDSIWFNNQLQYVESQTGSYSEDVYVVVDKKKSGFYETHKTKLSTYTIDSLTFFEVERFDLNRSENLEVKTLYRARNIGIIRFELVNGEIWTNSNLKKFGQNTRDSFTYTENTCD